MSRPWLAAAYLCALVVPLCEGVWSGLELARGSLAGLALLPWLALAGAPRAGAAGAPLRAALVIAAWALPPLLLGAGVDLARGADPRTLALATATGWAVLLVWSAAAERAAGGARALHAALWLVLVPGAAALRLALAWAPVRGELRAGPGTLYAADPLVWCHRWARAGGLEHARAGEHALALLGAGVVLAVVWTVPRARGGAA